MSTADVLVYLGVAFLVVGAVVFLWPYKPTQAEAQGLDPGKILEEINKLLDKFDKRYRPGLVLMLIGLTLVGVGIYKGTLDAKDAAKDATQGAALAPRRG